jgi:osmoprotectant transport system permease protein
MMTIRALLLSALVPLAASGAAEAAAPSVKVGSKKFTESVILGELVTQLADAAGARAVHLRELGGTRVLWDALLRREIDIYPEYTGTLRQELVPSAGTGDDAALQAELASRGIRMTRSLGFNDTYAIGVRRDVADRLGIRTLSDLARHPELKLGFSHEFMDRADGWPVIRDGYHLTHRDVRGLDHDLAYRGMQSGAIQATDLYSTDAEIQYYDLKVLEDDRHLFPDYQAILLYRDELEQRAPQAIAAIRRLEGLISAEEMIRLNAEAKLRHVPEANAAAAFLAQKLGIQSAIRADSVPNRIMRRTLEHLSLVSVSLLAAIVISIPLGILSAKRQRLGSFILGLVGVIQTIPSLALLVFMIPLLGIGAGPAIVALFLYSLLPIVRNTHSGLTGIALDLRESAEALGLPAAARLRLIELPLASPSILAGIKTSAVINVGTATLGALIGAGGYGQPILTGIRLDSVPLILEGAVPAAALALLAQGLFGWIERTLVPKGLRL